MAFAARLVETAARGVGALVLVALVLALALNVVSRAAGSPVVGANLAAAWLLPTLAFLALPQILPASTTVRGALAALVSGYAVGALGVGMGEAAIRIGGTEPVLGVPVSLRFWVGAGACAAAFFAALLTGWWRGFIVLGAVTALLPLPALPPLLAIAVFALALFVRTPVALALIAAVALAPGPLSDAALAQSVMRGLSGYVLLAVPLFILAAGLMVAGGIGEHLVAAARALSKRRGTGLGEANVVASLLFGGVSASSIADVATGSRLLVPPMIQSGYTLDRAAAITACSAVLPNILPPSIALLLAAAATDLSVGALWLAGAFAAPVLAVALIVAVRLAGSGNAPPSPPPQPTTVSDTPNAEPNARAILIGLLPALAIAVALLGALRLGFATAVEAGVIAVLLAAVFAVRTKGMAGLLTAIVEAAGQAGRVGLLIAAAAPVGFLVASSGFDFAALLPAAAPLTVLLAAVVVCLLVGTVLDAGAAILLVLPVMAPAVVAGGVDPVHGVLTLTIALLVGGLTPPVGILILVVKEMTGAERVYLAVVPYVAALLIALCVVAAAPVLFDAVVSTK
ncbi:MAG: TRAP transporter large permease subunit [Pseudomonadota bacterium]